MSELSRKEEEFLESKEQFKQECYQEFLAEPNWHGIRASAYNSICKALEGWVVEDICPEKDLCDVINGKDASPCHVNSELVMCSEMGKIQRPLKPEELDWEKMEIRNVLGFHNQITILKYIYIPATTKDGKPIRRKE